jgi:hypothetical protein
MPGARLGAAHRGPVLLLLGAVMLNVSDRGRAKGFPQQDTGA